MRRTLVLAIFALTYLFIAGVRIPWVHLDRTGGALLGAVAMVVLGAVTPAEVLGYSADSGHRAIDGDTIILLLGMMLLTAYLSEAAFFRTAAYHAVRLARTPRMLVVAIGVVGAVMSAFLVNDTICLMLTPLVLAVVDEAKLPPLPYLLALCMCSNAGSAATFTGNPQNMLIQGASNIPYAEFAARMVGPSAVATAVTIAVLLWVFRRQLPRGPIAPHPAPPPVDRPLLILSSVALLGVVVGFFLDYPMGWTALAGASFVMALSRREPRRALEKVDFLLLLFFAALFVVVFAVNKEGWPLRMKDAFGPLLAGGPSREVWGFAGLSLVASNLFSNVPFVMLARAWVPALHNPTLGWEVLALASTLAGNLTLIGSVANLIVFELARERYKVGFWEYARIGIPVTLLSLVLGMAVLIGEHALIGRPGEVRVFDVGYGDAVLVSSDGRQVLFDTGPAERGEALVEKLRAAGVTGLDLIVLSHPHPDHAGGLAAILAAKLPVRELWISAVPEWKTVPAIEAARAAGVEVRVVAAGVQEHGLRVLFPHTTGAPDPNNDSLVVLVGETALFPGDLVDPALQAALCASLPARLSLLKLPHHGELLAPCLERADTYLLSVNQNPWGLPRPQTIARLGERIRRTDVSGDLTVPLR